MYSVVMMTMMATTPALPEFGRAGRGAGCAGYSVRETYTYEEGYGRRARGGFLSRFREGRSGRGGCYGGYSESYTYRSSGYGCHGGGVFHAPPVQSAPPAQAQPTPPAQPMPKSQGTATIESSATVIDPLAVVNARRARMGLRPFERDGLLQAAAQRCAEFRAARRIHGHTSSDFAFAQGVPMRAAGAGVTGSPDYFMACCVTDNYAVAGAGSAMGPDGQWYHSIFVR